MGGRLYLNSTNSESLRICEVRIYAVHILRNRHKGEEMNSRPRIPKGRNTRFSLFFLPFMIDNSGEDMRLKKITHELLFANLSGLTYAQKPGREDPTAIKWLLVNRAAESRQLKC